MKVVMRAVGAATLLISLLSCRPREAPVVVPGPEPPASSGTQVARSEPEPEALPTASTPLPAPSSSAPWPSFFEEVPGFAGAYAIRVPPAVRVSVGGQLSCAVMRHSSVWCWRGPGASDGAPSTFATPSLVGLRGVSGLSIGAGWICGAGAVLQSLGDDPSPEVEAPPTLTDVRAVSMGDAHGCAVHGGGRVRCWGSTSFGRLGTRPLGVAGDVPGVQPAVGVSAGLFGGCAVERSGRLVCWGAASLIPWAPGGPGVRPPEVTGPTALRGVGDVVSVSLGSGQPCLVRRSGRVLCWSPEDAATLLPQNPLPPGSEVRGVSDAVAISGSLVLRKGGKLAHVQQAMSEQGATWFEAVSLGDGALGEVIDADGGRGRGCAVEKSGRVVCWAG